MPKRPDHGSVLVDRVIAAERPPKRPLSRTKLSRLAVAGKKAPPSLCRLLEHDSTWLKVDLAGERLSAIARRAAVRLWRALGQDVAKRSVDWKELDRLYPGKCVSLGRPHVDESEGTVEAEFLYVGAPDASGEYPVLCYLQSDDEPTEIGIVATDLGVWLAKRSGILRGNGPAHLPPAYAAILQGHADRNFAGCFSHVQSDVAEAHEVGNGLCHAALGRRKQKGSGGAFGVDLAFTGRGPLTVGDVRRAIMAKGVAVDLTFPDATKRIGDKTEFVPTRVVPKGSSPGDRRGLWLRGGRNGDGDMDVFVDRTAATSPELLAAVVHAIASQPGISRALSGSRAVATKGQRDEWLAWIAKKPADKRDWSERYWELREGLHG